jgi:hypothetical protein
MKELLRTDILTGAYGVQAALLAAGIPSPSRGPMTPPRLRSLFQALALLTLGVLFLGAWARHQPIPSNLPPLFSPGNTVVDVDGTEYPVKEVSGDWVHTKGLSGADYWLHVPSGRTWRAK